MTGQGLVRPGRRGPVRASASGVDFREDPMTRLTRLPGLPGLPARDDLTGRPSPSAPHSPQGGGAAVTLAAEGSLAVPLDRLAPLAAVAAWLATDPRPDVAAALVAVIRTDTRIELDPEEVSAVLADARSEGLDAEIAFERLILQGEWLAMDRLARIRPR